MKDGSRLINSLASFYFFFVIFISYRNLFQNGTNDMLIMVNVANDFLSTKKKKKKKKKNTSKFSVVRIIRFCSNFTSLLVYIFIKELQILFLISNFSNINGNMEELELKIECKKLMVPCGPFIVANSDFKSLKYHL